MTYNKLLICVLPFTALSKVVDKNMRDIHHRSQVLEHLLIQGFLFILAIFYTVE